MKVLAIYDRSGPKYHRILMPTYLMPDIELIVSNEVNEELLEGVDILFINRLIANKPLFEICELRKKYGFKIILDFDDHWVLDPSHFLFQTYKESNVSDIMEAYIFEADAVTVTHERLYNDVIKINPNCHILPNAIPKFGQFLCKKTESAFPRLFWAGSITHKKDIELLKNPIKKIPCGESYSFGVRNALMVMGGYNAKSTEYRAMASYYTNGGRMRHNLIKALPVDEYYYMYSECDIALIPLQDSTFNRHKSNLKILEAANIQSPVIVSKVHPYLDFPEDLVNYVEKQPDWNKHIKKLLNDPEGAKEQGRRLHDYCLENFNFNKINEHRLNLFKNVAGEQTKVREIPGEVRNTG